MTPLGTVAEISTGYPFRKKVESDKGGDVLLVQIKTLDGTEGNAGTGVTMLRNEQGRYDRYLLLEGDVLFQSRGSRHPAVVVEPGVRGIAAVGLYVIRPDKKNVLPEYVAWWLNHPHSQTKLIEDVARGSYIPFVSKGALDAFLIPKIPLEKQRQIIELDLLRRRERALVSRLEQLKQQVVDDTAYKIATTPM